MEFQEFVIIRKLIQFGVMGHSKCLEIRSRQYHFLKGITTAFFLHSEIKLFKLADTSSNKCLSFYQHYNTTAGHG